jgi:hypothetical protein
MDAKLRYPIPARFAVAEVADLQPFQARENMGFGLPVAEGAQPIREGFTAARCLVPDQVEYKTSVTYMLQRGNVEIGCGAQ